MTVPQTSTGTAAGPPRKGRGPLAGAVCVLAALAAMVLLMAFWMRVFAPEHRLAPQVPFQGYDMTAIQDAVSSERVAAEVETMSAFGSRFLGQPGHARTREYIEKTLRETGLEVVTQDNWSLAPVTLERRISDADGQRLPDVQVYPFQPNCVQPMVTPEGGISGELVLLTAETILERTRFDDCIGLLYGQVDEVPEEFQFNWSRYAALGVRALIVAHPEGMDAVEWRFVASRAPHAMVNSLPINYVRVAATKGIFDYVGKTVRLDVRQEFREIGNTSVVAVLRSSQRARRALVLSGSYDACSILPDLAPGAMQLITPATILSLAKGLAAGDYADTIRRDVVFVLFGAQFMANDGENNLLSMLGPNLTGSSENALLAAFGIGDDEDEAADDDSRGESRIRRKTEARGQPLVDRIEENKMQLALVASLRSHFDSPGFLTDAKATDTVRRKLEKEAKVFLDEQVRYVLNTLVLERSETMLRARIAFERRGDSETDSDEYRVYMAAKKLYDDAMSAAGYSIINLLKTSVKRQYAEEHDLKGLLVQRFDEIVAHHQRQLHRLEQGLKLVEVFSPYDDMTVIEPRLAPAVKSDIEEVVSFRIGNGRPGEPQAAAFQSVLSASRERLPDRDVVDLLPLPPRQDTAVNPHLGGVIPWSSTGMWMAMNYPSFFVVNLNRVDSYYNHSFPVDLPFMRDISTIAGSLQLLGESVLSIAHGNGEFQPRNKAGWTLSYGGHVLVSNVGQSIVPNYPLKGAIVWNRGREDGYEFEFPGYFEHKLVQTDVYGRYDLPNQTSNFVGWAYWWANRRYDPVAHGYGKDGLIAYMKDEGEEGQRLFKSVGLHAWRRDQVRNVNIVTFRAVPVTILDLINPQTLKSYTGIDLVAQRGLKPFGKKCIFKDGPVITTFVKPDERFFVKLLSGAADNERVQKTRAFMLGTSELYEEDKEKEIDGPGFLAFDNPLLLDIPFQVSRSMSYLNGKRLELQNRYAMADERTNEFHEKSNEKIGVTETEVATKRDAILAARDAVTYSTLNHPVLRESIGEAVVGILWYLGLLVPFVFFFEKLVFGFSDIRKQIVTQLITFVIVFFLLRELHPAFEMIRSSMMILLGFFIILISGGITVLFIGKFQENLEDLKKRQGKVSAAEVHTLGVVGVSFMLGLNNMHRRRVRTGLTCLTLVLMTFVMICFTSVDTDLVDTETAVGKAPYQGILYKEEKFRVVTAENAIREKYGDKFDVCPRHITVGFEWRGEFRNPTFEVLYEDGEIAKKAEFNSIVQLCAEEPLRHHIKLLTERPWFSEEDDLDSDDPPKVLLPDRIANLIGLSAQDVNAEEVHVRVSGRDFIVQGIFEAKSVTELRDLDGTDILPFDVEGMTSIQKDLWRALAEDDDPRISAENLIICPTRDLGIRTDGAEIGRLVSLAISMPELPYKEARDVINEYLEQSGQSAHYGLDGVVYMGERSRQRTLGGVLELIIPLIIAALTVLNTMKGSVYERTDEIFVYNSVGIAPKYVFFMFFAEAFVYAVVGSVAGYILSQGVGRVLTALELTGGMNMTYTSTTSIYASIAVALSVFVSTYFPAKRAMEIAAPAEDAGWRLPEPDGDELAFDLPFTFDYRDRLAILSFFSRYLKDHGEGSAGRFFAGSPVVGISDRIDELADGAYVPEISVPVWLKPFDLGVSQRMIISLATDPETQEFKAHIRLLRLSGTRDAWIRLNRGYVALIRRHFLHWRAVDEAQRQEMFIEAQVLLRTRFGLA